MSNKERAPLLRKDMLMCGVALIASTQLEPYLQEYTVYGQYVCYAVAASNAITIARNLPRVMMNRLMRRRALRASINHGDARWLSETEIKRKGLYRTDNTLFIGLCAETGKPLFTNLEPHGFLYAATGSGKTRDYFIPTLLHYSGSIVTIDMKGTQAAITTKMRREQFGHKIIYINPAQLHEKLLGLSSRYNPLQIIIDAWLSGCIQDVITFTREIVMQLYPAGKYKSEGINTNQYFHNGTQGLLIFVILYLVVLSEDDATLNAAFIMLCDEDAMEAALYKALASDLLCGDLALMAKKILTMSEADNTEHWKTFREGAAQELDVFSTSGWLAENTSTSDFRFADTKTQRMTIYIISDPARRNAFEKWVALLGWCYMQEMFLAKCNKAVPFLLDEASNVAIHNLMSRLTDIREYGGRFFFSFQSMTAMQKTYGKDDVQIMKDQCSLQIYQNVEDHVLSDTISKMLGNTTIVTQNTQLGHYTNDLAQGSVSETAQPLLSSNQVRKVNHSIISIRGEFVRAWPVGYHQVTPWRNQAAINPIYKKAYKGKIYLRLRYPRNW